MNKPIVLLLIAVFLVLTFSSILHLSGTCDELGHHIAGGYVILTKGDFKIDTSHPPLARYIIALPLKVFLKVDLPEKKEWRNPERTEFSRDFFYKYNHQPLEMLRLSRSAIILVGLICALILFLWARAMYGEAVGCLSLFFYVFSPAILAHASLATIDMTATCSILLALYSLWLFFHKPDHKHMLLAGASLGLAQISKYSALILYPAFIILAVVETLERKEEAGKLYSGLTQVFLLSLAVIWMGYGFEFQPILKDVMRQQEKIAMAHNLARKIIPFLNTVSLGRLDNFLLNVPIPLGSHLLGIMGLLRRGLEGQRIYFHGQWSTQGNPFYFLIGFLLKNPIPYLVFLFLGLIAIFRRKISRNEWFLIIPVLLIFAGASFSRLQLGIRYILPLFPLTFILAARGVALLKGRGLKIITFLLLTWQIFSVFWAWPDYLSYFNEFVGGPKNGYKYLRDSDVDWGQDLPALSDYVKKNRLGEVVLEYFGQADPAIYGIPFRKFSESEYSIPQRKLYAISAHYLEHASWTKYYRPSASAGYSILIYDFRER